MGRLNPYDCSRCDSEDCSGCGEHAYDEGYKNGLVEAFDTPEFEEAASEWAIEQGWRKPE